MDHSRIQPGEKRSFDVFVEGQPAQQGSKIPGKRKDGSLFMRESARGLPAWRDLVIATARSKVGPGWQPLNGPLWIDLNLWMPRPASHPKTVYTLPTSPPDLDKLIRAIGDSLTQASIIVDDARFVDLSVSERYAGGPMPTSPVAGARIQVGML